MSDIAGYLQGNLEHHVDHLAPLCSLMGWPLIVTNEEIYKLAEAYYPDLTLHLWSPLEAPFKVTEQFDTVVTTLPRISFDEIFFIAEAALRKRLKTIWLPHGNSDKGDVLPWMEALRDEEAAFVYGPKMVDFLREKNVHIPHLISIGNFRYLYFKKHQSFYENLLNEMGLSSSFVLYAPTWRDAENSSSFEEHVDALIQQLAYVRLVIKPHPNELEEIGVIQRQLRTQVQWVTHFPPIYPLLSRASHLIGDFSSIGYDFLQFNRPLIFLNSKKSAGKFLHAYGTTALPNELYLDQLVHPSEKIEALKTYTFGEESSWNTLVEGVKQLDI